MKGWPAAGGATRLVLSPVRIFCLLLLFGAVPAFGLVLCSGFEKKHFAFFLFSLVGLFLTLTVRDLKFFFLCAAFLALPVNLGIFFLYQETPFLLISPGLKASLFDIPFFLLFAIWILKLLFAREALHFPLRLHLPLLIFLLFTTLSAFLAPHKRSAIFTLILVLKCYLVFLYLSNNVKTRREFRAVALCLMAGLAFQGFIGILQYLLGGTLGLEFLGEARRGVYQKVLGEETVSRVGGTIGAPNSLAMYLNLFIPLGFALLFSSLSLLCKLSFFVVLGAGTLAELFTLSRGGWIALSAALLFAAFFCLAKVLRRIALSGLILAVFALFTIPPVILFSSMVRTRLFGEDYGSAESRIPMLEVAFNMVEEHPVTGVGLDNYTRVMNRYDTTPMGISYIFPFPVHNVFLHLAAETGVISLLALLLFLFLLFLRGLSHILRSPDPFLSLYSIGILGGILAYFVHGQIKSDFIGTNVGLWILFGLAEALSRAGEEPRRGALDPA